MNVLIIEDEDLTAERLQTLLTQYDPAIRVVAVLPSVAESVQWLQTHARPDQTWPDQTWPDLIFMDIHLEDDSCFRIFDRVPLSVPVIFTTAFDEYMIKAFKVNSIDYLLKPVSYADLKGALHKYHLMKQQFAQPDFSSLRQALGIESYTYRSRFLITIGARLRTVETTDIAYFYSEEKITFLVTKDNQRLPIDFSLDKLMPQLNPAHFFRANRQFILSLGSICQIHTYSNSKLKLEIQPTPKTEVFISKERVALFKSWLDT